jgi:N-methylhydantoinase A
VRERLRADGSVAVPLDQASLDAAIAALKAERVEAVAVCFLHSYVNPEHEQRMAELLQAELPGVYLTLSHEVLREYREYERTSTTVLNSYIGPRVSRYLGDLAELLDESGFRGRLLIMQSNGGVMSPEVARKLPVAIMESGPVGGIIAAAEVGKALGYLNVIAFDMGGTTAKCSAVRDGTPEIAQGYYIGGIAAGHPVMLPVVDIVEVGTGGGSIAWIDEVGALRVGPRSAGGDPGPIAYGWGGTEPTITDADALLGRLNPSRFLGGEMPLDLEGARRGLREKVADRIGLGEIQTALGVLKIAESAMSLAVRQVSVERGYDPRDFVMVAMGGAGPAHAVAVARELHIPTVIVPRLPAHFSALGMLLADLRHDYVRTVFRPIVELDFGQTRRLFEELSEQGRAVLEGEGAAHGGISFEWYFDVRYVGQEFTLQVPTDAEMVEKADRDGIRRAFNEIHELRHGQYSSEEPIEIVNLRVVARGRRERPNLPPLSGEGGDALVDEREVYFEDASAPLRTRIYNRDLLRPGQRIEGPAIVEEYGSTVPVHPGFCATVDDFGNLLVRRTASSSREVPR